MCDAWQMRVGVIGMGFGDRVVAPSFAATDGVEVVEVVSARNDHEVLALCRRRDLDLVSVHSPPFLHRRHVETALAAGHHVLCDKPFGLDAAEADAMVAAAATSGLVAMLNFEFRCHPGRRALRDLVEGGEVGRLEHLSWFHHLNGARLPVRPFGWLFDADLGGGWIGAWMSHVVDAIRWITGQEIVEVAGVRRLDVAERPRRDGSGSHRCSAEDGVAVVLHAGDVVVTVDSTFVAVATLPSRIVLTGDRSVVESVADTTITIRGADRSKEERQIPPHPGDPHLGPMLSMARLVRDSVRAGVALGDVPTFADGLACAKVLDRLRALPLTICG